MRIWVLRLNILDYFFDQDLDLTSPYFVENQSFCNKGKRYIIIFTK